MKVIERAGLCRQMCRLLGPSVQKKIAFVPTMGALHAGHRALLDQARRLGGVVVLSIFVNPTQFGPNEDLARYPKREKEDLAMAEAAGVDIVFRPSVEEMYPSSQGTALSAGAHGQTSVEVEALSLGLCGPFRPGHFRGVCTIVSKLFHVVEPDFALFGEKDYQQLTIIKRMARDLLMDVEIVAVPTVREADGLAASSRNAYLNPNERARAAAVSAALRKAQAAAAAGKRTRKDILAAAEAVLVPAVTSIDYLDLVDAETLEPVEALSVRPPGNTAICAVAAYVGTTRLIDNIRIGPA